MRFKAYLRRLAQDTAGNAMMLATAALIPLTILIGSAVDMSVAYTARVKLQNACDSAVLAGRQSMQGPKLNRGNRAEANKFFDFNSPAATMNVRNVKFSLQQNNADHQELIGTASADVPTSIMTIFGYQNLPISVSCDAKRDQAHNDVVLVLDVTGSMRDSPSSGGDPKIDSLRTGAAGLYRALADAPNSQTRYGIVPYSQTVNVARSLSNNDILLRQDYVDKRCWGGRCVPTTKSVHINQTKWGNPGNGPGRNKELFRESGEGCIEERPSYGEAASPVRILDSVSRADIDKRAENAADEELQFGRYDPQSHTGTTLIGGSGFSLRLIVDKASWSLCPAEASRLRTYPDEDSFSSAIATATKRVYGGTYHDVGLLWGARFISRTGFFSDDNPTAIGVVPVDQHIVFMTDGEIGTLSSYYSAHGIEMFQARTQGWGSLNDRHLTRFADTCSVAKSMGITIWVIALDVGNTEDIEPCATSSDHFFVSDGSDLEQVFASIGQGIGNLRLTR